MGTAAQSLAIGWEVYARTDQALSLGLVGLFQAIPMILIILPAGYLADVYDRRKLMMLSLTGATLTSFGLAILSLYQISLKWTYLMLFLDALFIGLGSPAQRAITPLLIPKEHFENAVKWSSSLIHLTGIVGPAIGGIIISFNIEAAYILSAFSSIAFIIFLSTMVLPPAPKIKQGKMIGQIVKSLYYVRKHRLLFGSMSLDLFAVLLGGAVYLLPIFARDIINLSSIGIKPETALGWLRSAPAIGAFIMALTIAHLPTIKNAGKTLFWSVAGFGLATIIFGISQNFWLSLLMLAITGALDNISVVIRRVISQMTVPNQMRGRVQAITAIFVGSSNEIGGFESGLIAHIFNPVFSVVSGGIGTLIIVAAWTGLFPSLRNLGSLSSLKVKN